MQAQISLRHPSGQEIIRSSPQATQVRWDLPVEKGQSVELWLSGSDSTETPARRPTSCRWIRTPLPYTATPQLINSRSTYKAIPSTSTEQPIGWENNPVVQLQLLDWQPADQLIVQGSAADETFAISSDKLNIALGKSTQISVYGSTTQLLDGGAGRNVAHWLGSAQSEELWLQGRSATVLGTYRTDLRNFTTSEFTGQGGMTKSTGTTPRASIIFLAGSPNHA